MDKISEIKVEGVWHIIIEPDYEIKEKPPFPPKIKVYITIPDTKFAIIEPLTTVGNIDETYYRTAYLEGQCFAFIIRYSPDKDTYKQIADNVRGLNRKYHLNIDEDYRIDLIKGLYGNNYFRYGEVNVKSIEKIILSKEYLKKGFESC